MQCVFVQLVACALIALVRCRQFLAHTWGFAYRDDERMADPHADPPAGQKSASAPAPAQSPAPASGIDHFQAEAASTSRERPEQPAPPWQNAQQPPPSSAMKDGHGLGSMPHQQLQRPSRPSLGELSLTFS